MQQWKRYDHKLGRPFNEEAAKWGNGDNKLLKKFLSQCKNVQYIAFPATTSGTVLASISHPEQLLGLDFLAWDVTIHPPVEGTQYEASRRITDDAWKAFISKCSSLRKFKPPLHDIERGHNPTKIRETYSLPDSVFIVQQGDNILRRKSNFN